MNLAGWILPFARRLLYAVVRTRVFPQDIGELGLDAAVPVCYVLQHRRFSNLMVLMAEARRAGLPPPRGTLAMGTFRAHRAFFFITRPQPLAAKAKDRYGHSPLLVGIVREALANPAADMQIVPVTILWGQAPDQQDSLLKALFSETWRPPSQFRQLLAILLHGRHTVVRFGTPLRVRGLIDKDMGEAQALRKLSRVLRVHFRRQREMAIGPDLSHRHTQVTALLGAPPVRAAIAAEAAAAGISAAAAASRARGYALEIAADYSYGVVRAFDLFLNWLWNRLYDGVEVHGFAAVASIAPGSGIVYVPCHRSHIDYLLLSFVIFHRGLMPPHIAAGANLDLPVVGPLLRRGGAFFLRRQFKGNALYAAVFDEYLHRMLARGFPVEYFIEGGRSRSGRTLAPKTGLLGMTVKSFLRSHERPLFFVPVYIGYEKLLEGDSFVGELAGRPKQGESLWRLLSVVRRLRHDFGKVHVNFGRALDLGAFLDTAYPAWQATGGDVADGLLRPATRDVAAELVRRINEAAVANPVNLVALALLASPKHTLDETTLQRLLGHYQALLAGVRYGDCTQPCTASPAALVADALRLNVVARIAHPLGDLWCVPAPQAALLAYFRNNVLHLFALPALVACLLAHNLRLPRSRIEAAVAGLYGLLRPELFLRWTPAEVPAVLDAILDVMAVRGLVAVDAGGMLAAPAPASAEAAELQLLGETMRPTLERHFLTLALLQRHGSGRLTRQTLEEASHLLAQRLALLYEFNAPEFSEKALFAAVVGNMIDAGLISEDPAGRLHFDAHVTAPAAHAELLLAAEVRQTIRRIADAGPAHAGAAAREAV
ncbi:MAG: glycerol-3-phosphate 1-O-acyltransferase PlsB [Rhodocyclaceae bacterium]|nr:glycerol-3-phosphate 1-O-acyltransferase PlsB [Rhodocyclaceae bacterium]